MDYSTFDRLTRQLGRGGTRRSILRAAFALAFGAVGTARIESVSAAATKRANGRVCAKAADCQSGVCAAGRDGRKRCGCNVAADCPAAPGDCVTVSCQAGYCGFGFKLPGTACGDAGACRNDGVCGCASHAQCEDGSPCTQNACGPNSHRCYSWPIFDDTCVVCSGDQDCNGGTCCGGRCCAAGAVCQWNGSGPGICCDSCAGGSVLCCDQIGIGSLERGVCVGEDSAQGLPGFCCANGTGRYEYDSDGNVLRDDNGQPVSYCVAPAFAFD